jgi:hypothetical protein
MRREDAVSESAIPEVGKMTIGEKNGEGENEGESSRCATCPVEKTARCLGLEARTIVSVPGRLCELAARDSRYAIELKRMAGERGLPPRRH